jgi:hypothetical protein
MFVQDHLPPSLFEAMHDIMREQENLLEQQNDSQANDLECLHGSIILASSVRSPGIFPVDKSASQTSRL